MSNRKCDIAIIGGGLAGGLIALALRAHRPDVKVLVIEAGAAPGGNHRWSWFESDLPKGGAALLDTIQKTGWNAGYEVIFPGHSRVLKTPYRSIASADFAAALDRELPPGTIVTGSTVERLASESADLADGSRVAARAVIDCRGSAGSRHLTGGWQVFLGRHMRLASAHGLTRPVIMDATVDQLGGYRFVYVLPLGPNDVFLEDTYYQDTPSLDRAALSRRLDEYAHAHYWDGDVVAEETGVLPVITGGDFAAFQAEHRVPGVARAGARGGFVHPLTSYTLPFAVEVALLVARNADLAGEKLADLLEKHATAHWRRTRLYRMLGAMLMGAAAPHQRYRVFQRFYGLSEPLIERFYAARSTSADAIRILAGKPPVPVGKAIVSLAGAQPPLLDKQSKEALS